MDAFFDHRTHYQRAAGALPKAIGVDRWGRQFMVLAARADIRKLPELRSTTVRSLPGIGRKYAALIKAWQKEARLSDDAEWTGPMLHSDARRLLVLRREIEGLERKSLQRHRAVLGGNPAYAPRLFPK